MAQDQQSGAEANDFGRQFAPRLAGVIGATLTRRGSNEARFNNQRVVLKSARIGNQKIGVSYDMLTNLDAVIAAFERQDGDWDVYSVPAAAYSGDMEPTASRGPSSGKVGVIRRRDVERSGTYIGRFSV